MTAWSDELKKGAAYLAEVDQVLAEVIAKAPLPAFLPHKNYYQELVESIISQQLSVKAAATILKRFKALFDADFPTPEAILEQDVEVYRSVGLSRQKASYIRDLAEKVLDGSVTFDRIDSMTNEEVIAMLLPIKGVGLWTIHMFLMFCMGRFDILPTGDLGIRNGIQKLYGLEIRPDEQAVTVLANERQWHPYETIASWYVWHSLDNKPAL